MTATAIVVLFRTTVLDLRWIDPQAPIIAVHNDDSEPQMDARVEHLRPGANVGFGAAVNLALPLISTERVVLFNPDMELEAVHWDALAGGGVDEIVTVPIVGFDSTPTSTVNRYYSPLAFVLTALRIGRLLRRGTALRRALTPLLGAWGRAHQRSLEGTPRPSVPLREAWVSGAAFSLATDRFAAVEGFDDSYFMYFEDVDLCQRLAAAFPAMQLREADVPPARHAIGGSAHEPEVRRAVRDARLRAACRYAGKQRGARWRIAELVVGRLGPLVVR